MVLGPGAKPYPEDEKPEVTPEPEVTEATEPDERPKRFSRKADDDG